MGFQDRDYYSREASPLGGGVRLPQTMVGRIILINVVVFLIDAFWTRGGGPAGLQHPLSDWMSLPPDIVSRPWGLLTYGFAHSPLDHPGGIWHILLNMYSLWLFGRDVEQVYGSKEFVRFYLAFIVIAGLVWGLLTPGGAAGGLVGASGAVTGIMVLFVMHFPHRRFLMFPIPFQIPAWLLCTLIIGMDVWGALGHRGTNIAFVAHLAGAASAFLYYRSGIRTTRLLPPLGWPRAFSNKPRLKVHKPSRREERLESQADAILQKVHQHGADSISDKERRILDEYSRRVREKRQ